MGVWIETLYRNDYGFAVSVTPCVGVWIETLIHYWTLPACQASHPAWVCGLKHVTMNFLLKMYKVTPCVGVWIETG